MGRAVWEGDRMKSFFVGVLATLIVLILGGAAWLYSGGLPVATSGNPLPMERTIAHIAIHAAMRGEADQHSPVLSDEPNLMAGAKLYKNNCAVCHGITGQRESSISAGMFPRPPALMPPHKGVTDDPAAETFWLVKNGIRMTGMPGFAKSLSDTEIWQLAALLQNTDKLPLAVKTELEK